jgi:hypothetical protein
LLQFCNQCFNSFHVLVLWAIKTRYKSNHYF